jgi:hypothetical protein
MALDDELRAALDHATAGRWQAAHEIVQEHEDDPLASWIHAVVHRIEGDLGNARYWYRRCGQPSGETLAPEVELARIRSALDARRETL